MLPLCPDNDSSVDLRTSKKGRGLFDSLWLSTGRVHQAFRATAAVVRYVATSRAPSCSIGAALLQLCQIGATVCFVSDGVMVESELALHVDFVHLCRSISTPVNVEAC